MKLEKVGIQIGILCEKAGITRNKLCDGLCSESELALIEKGESSADVILFAALLERLGKSAERLTYILTMEEYKRFMARNEIEEALRLGLLKEAEQKFARYRRENPPKKKQGKDGTDGVDKILLMYEEKIKGILILEEYEKDSHTGMDVKEMSYLIYSYTSGYPYLVSRLCKLIDERVAGTKEFCDRTFAWTKAGFLEAVKLLLDEDNPLFDSLMNKLEQFPELKTLISRQLFQGKPIAYNAADQAVRNAKMFGFVKVRNSTVSIANRIFESRLYNRFLLNYPGQDSKIYREGSRQKNQFVADGHLNMRKVLEKFVETFEYLYGDKEETFLEEEGRRYFMLFLRPIINGTGNCYVEPETRNQERMDLVIDYLGEQSVCELKIWRGNAYHERGERQLLGYLDHFGLNKGYMLSFNFNKKKEVGVKDMRLGDKLLIEAVV